MLSVFHVKIFSIFGSPYIILVHSRPILRMRSPTYALLHKPPPLHADYWFCIRAKVADWGELGAKVTCRVPLKINQLSRWDHSRIVGPISVLRIQRAVSVGKTKKSVGLGALYSCVVEFSILTLPGKSCLVTGKQWLVTLEPQRREQPWPHHLWSKTR